MREDAPEKWAGSKCDLRPGHRCECHHFGGGWWAPGEEEKAAAVMAGGRATQEKAAPKAAAVCGEAEGRCSCEYSEPKESCFIGGCELGESRGCEGFATLEEAVTSCSLNPRCGGITEAVSVERSLCLNESLRCCRCIACCCVAYCACGRMTNAATRAIAEARHDERGLGLRDALGSGRGCLSGGRALPCEGVERAVSTGCTMKGLGQGLSLWV